MEILFVALPLQPSQWWMTLSPMEKRLSKCRGLKQSLGRRLFGNHSRLTGVIKQTAGINHRSGISEWFE